MAPVSYTYRVFRPSAEIEPWTSLEGKKVIVEKLQQSSTAAQRGGPKVVRLKGTSNLSQGSTKGLSVSTLALKVMVMEGGRIPVPMLTQLILGATFCVSDSCRLVLSGRSAKRRRRGKSTIIENYNMSLSGSIR